MSDNSQASSPTSDSSSTPPPSPPKSDSPPPSTDSSSPTPPDSSPPPPSPPSSDSASPPPSSGGSQTPPPPSDSGNSNSPAPPTSSTQPPPSDSGNSNSPAPPTSSTQPPPSDSGGNKGNDDGGGNNNDNSGNGNNNDNSGGGNNNDNSGGNNDKSPSKQKGDSPVPPSRSGDDGSNNSKPQLSHKSGSSDNSNESSIIGGAAAGAGLLLLIMIVFVVSCAKRKKRKKHDHELKYYRDNSNMKNYYNNGPNWQNRPPNDHLMMKMPPHGNAGMSGEHMWGPPPPPPPMMSSSEMSSAGFSGQAMPPPHPAVALGFNQSSFTYEDLAAATAGFARENLLGQGGFGYVHKGVLPNGKEIAVKSLKMNSGQGEREFQAEVDIISRVHHRHLVSLVGWCSTGAERLLVYEFVPNGTLEYHLHGAGRPTMDWPTRVKIALGSAKGFAYLHEDCHPRIIHRDIKAANILIDNHFDAKVADFGLAKLSSDNHTHVSTRIMGTFGYLAPEYASSGKLTEKSDVYSFGVMLLELITGRRPIDINSDDDSLVDWARPILMHVTEGGSYEELVDPRLGNNYDPQQMLQMVHSAGASIKHSARGRPRMSQIVRALEGDVSLEDLNAGSRGSTISSGSESDLKKLGKGGVMSSQEFSSSDEAQTGEFRR